MFKLPQIFTGAAVCAAILAGTCLNAEEKVLFIGNSFTLGSGGNASVAAIFDALARASGQDDPTTVIRAVGGKDYEYHSINSMDYFDAELVDSQAQQWTHVILQNYSTEPTHIGSVADHKQYGTLLYETAIANNPDTQVMLYMTWSRAEANGMISGNSTGNSFESTDQMIDELSSNYHALADELTFDHPNNLAVQVNPVGEAWRNAGGYLPANDPDFIDLYDSDNYHGDDRGYYLSACVHFASIYGRSPLGLYETADVAALGLTVSAEDAAFLENVAWQTVESEGTLEARYLIDFGSDANTSISQLAPGGGLE